VTILDEFLFADARDLHPLFIRGRWFNDVLSR